jgi:hypothetical protein
VWGFLAVVIVAIVVGMMWSTQRIDNYWTSRGSIPVPARRVSSSPPPFITSEDQCRDCGRDDELLNLDKRCIFCFHKAWVDG